MEHPTICRMVVYRSRTGSYDVPAVINCTAETIYPPGVDGGFVPALTGPDHVHLTVFTPGKPGMRQTAGKDAHTEDFQVVSAHPVSENVAGCYQEWDIPYDPDGGAGTWRWPARVSPAVGGTSGGGAFGASYSGGGGETSSTATMTAGSLGLCGPPD